MRKRLALLWTPFVLAIALMLPASAAAGSPGRIVFVDGYCSGADTVNGTFKVIKFAGYYATHLTMTARGQGYHNGSWRNEYNIGTWTKSVNTSARATMQRSFWYNPDHSGRHRIRVVGRILNGSQLMGKGSISSGWCS